MYTGTLIDDLMATVERAEENVLRRADSRQQIPAAWHEMAAGELRIVETSLLGVA